MRDLVRHRSSLGFAVFAAVSVALVSCSSSPGSPTEAPQVVLTTMTADERDRMTQEQLDQAWSAVVADHPDAVRPEVELVRYVFPDEWEEARIQCLADQGVEATQTSAGGVQTLVPEGQGEWVAIAGYICSGMYPMDPVANLPLNDSQFEYMYWYFTQVLTPCLEGFGVDVASPPSLTTFKETYYSEDFWSPYGSVGIDVDWEQINNECPQLGPDLYGNAS